MWLLGYPGWLLGSCYGNQGGCYDVTRWLVVVTDGHYVVIIEFLAHLST